MREGNLTMWAEDGTTQVLFRSRSKARREGRVLRMLLYCWILEYKQGTDRGDARVTEKRWSEDVEEK